MCVCAHAKYSSDCQDNVFLLHDKRIKNTIQLYCHFRTIVFPDKLAKTI